MKTKTVLCFAAIFIAVLGLCLWQNARTAKSRVVSTPAEEIVDKAPQSEETEGPVVVEASFSLSIKD